MRLHVSVAMDDFVYARFGHLAPNSVRDVTFLSDSVPGIFMDFLGFICRSPSQFCHG
jgi:hypothetical protein